MVCDSRRSRQVLALSVMLLPVGLFAAVVNGSFETPAAWFDGDTAVIAGPQWATDFYGWDYSSGFTMPVGIVNPNDSTFPGTSGVATPVPSPGDGVQMAYIRPTTVLYQTLTDTVQPNQTITLSAAIGSALDDYGGTVELLLYAVNPSDPTGSLSQQLLLNSELFSTWAAGEIVPVSFNYTAPASGTMVGQQMIVAIWHRGGSRLFVDNVVVAVPEPTVIAGIGLAGLLALRRRPPKSLSSTRPDTRPTVLG